MSTTTPEADRLAPAPAASEPSALFRYSTWLHVGVGALDCEEVDEDEGRNLCGDRAHFHAWCRLPNPLQHSEIRDRGLAAKARKIRQLRDPSTDAYDILEEEFNARAREGDRAKPLAIDDLLAIDWFRDLYEAMQEVRQEDDPNSQDEDAKRFRHVSDDQARFARLEAMPEDKRPKDEFEELRTHLAAYNAEVDAALKRITDPKRAALEQLDVNALLDLLRDKRVDAEATREFTRVFSIHQWLSCAYREPDGPPSFSDLAALERAANEVIDGLQVTFDDLTRTAQEARGN